MKVTIVEDPNIKETEISIVCSKMTSELKDIVASITTVGRTFAGKKENEIFFIPVKDIFYNLSRDDKSRDRRHVRYRGRNAFSRIFAFIRFGRSINIRP